MYIDRKYIGLLSSRLKRFKKKGENLWNFKCPLCNDSQKNEAKTRGYIYKRGQHFLFYCHNCFRSFKFSTFLKMVSPGLYKEYLLETFGGNKKEEEFDPAEFITNPVFEYDRSLLIDVPSITNLPDNHKAKRYVALRMIPEERWKNIYYTDNFKDFVNDLLPNVDKELGTEARIILPFYDRNDHLLGFQGRCLGYNPIKYITIKTDECNPKVYGWDNLDLNKTIYVVEGPIDSLFIDNSIASMDGDLTRVVPIIGVDKKYVFVYDCERRNKNIIRNMEKAINSGFHICIWPDSYEFKDINEGIIGGHTPTSIQNIINTNIFEGLEASLRLSQWVRI